MFYDELTPADEYHVSRTIGTLVLEEEEGSNTHDLGSGTLGSRTHSGLRSLVALASGAYSGSESLFTLWSKTCLGSGSLVVVG